MSLELCYYCKDITLNRLFNPEHLANDSQWLPTKASEDRLWRKFPSLNHKSGRCAMCAQLCIGIRRSFIGREFSPDEVHDIDKKINNCFPKIDEYRYVAWGLGKPVTNDTENNVTIRGKRLEGVEIIKAMIGRYSCTFGISRLSEPRPNSSRAFSYDLTGTDMEKNTNIARVRVWLSKGEGTQCPLPSRLEAQMDADTKSIEFESEEAAIPNTQSLSSTLESPRRDRICGPISDDSQDSFGSEGSPVETQRSLKLSQLPHRVLDLRRQDPSLSADICLLDNATQYCERYIALSHRWSSRPCLTLTEANFDKMCKNIPFQSLPLTFQDAVMFCRLMKVYYLWIDALCIKEGDQDEWRKESILMGQIYRNAECAIIAHCASGDNDGFLKKSLQRRNRVLLGSSEPSRGGAFYATLMDDSSFCIDKSPLSRRGWVFQERLLAERAVHFTRGHILMENMGNLTSEYCPDKHTSQRDQKRVLFGQGQMAPQEFRNVWARVVEDYSACDLTKPEDKIPAISGLAKVFHTHKSGQYFLAGLWSENLSEQLLWVSTSNSARRVQWRAPSWSWASIDGAVKFLRVSELAKRQTLSVGGFRSAQGDQPDWVDGLCVLTVHGSVVKWDERRMQGENMFRHDGHVCVAQNSDHFKLVEDCSREVRLLWSTREPGGVNGWVSYDAHDRTLNFGCASRGGTWTPLDSVPKPRPGNCRLSNEICVRVCSYAPCRTKGRPNVDGRKNHVFLILRRVKLSRLYRRIGVGEIFLDDFFDKKRVSES